MSNYTKATNFATKDALSSGNPLKIVKGTEINTEFDAIATAIATKADTASPTFTGTPSLPTGTTGVTQSTGDNSTKLATTAFVQAAATPISSAYPVGSVYINASDSTNPATLLGFGTWTALGEGRVLLGAGTGGGGTYTAGATGGSKDAITVSHTHTYSGTTGTGEWHAWVADENSAEFVTPDYRVTLDEPAVARGRSPSAPGPRSGNGRRQQMMATQPRTQRSAHTPGSAQSARPGTGAVQGRNAPGGRGGGTVRP